MDRGEQRAPLSFSQQEVWLRGQLAPEIPLGNQPITIRRRGRLDASALEAALGDLVRRHETWRTTFRIEDDQPVQVVHPPPALALPVVDLRGTAQPEREALALAAADAARPFDLGRGPLHRARLVRLGEEDHRLYLTVHRAIADRPSIQRRLLTELAGLYAARAEGGAVPPAPVVPYSDLARRQRAWAESPQAARQLDYWRRQLAGPPPTLELFPDRARPAVRGFRGARRVFTWDSRLTGALRLAAAEAAVSLEVLLLAAFIGLLHRHTGEDDLLVGALAAGRQAPEAQALLGCFTNPLALRVDLAGDPSWRGLLERVRAVAAAADAHAEVPFAHVVGAVQPIRDPARDPLVSNVFAFEPLGPAPPAGWELSAPEIDPGTAEADLQLDLHERADVIVGALTYRTALFEADTIARLEAQLRRLLEAALADPTAALSRLPLLDERERRQVVVDCNRTARPYPAGATVHALVEQQAARAPDRIALVAGDRRLTYGEVDARAAALAARLRGHGVGPGAIVGVALERSVEAIVGYLAVLKAGGAYLPLSITDPPDRVAFMLADAGARVVLGSGGATSALAGGRPVVDVDGGAAAPAPPGVAVTPDDLLYVMYTSGSSGRPKGVAVPHRGIVRLLFGQDGYTRLGPDEVILQATALSFDVSAFEIWGALVHGARLILSPSAIPTARELRDVIRRHGVTTMWLTPSVFNMVVDEDPECLAPLRQLDLGGEALSVPHVARAARVLSGTQLINGYGPTECSVAATGYLVPRTVDPAAASIPIGRPIGNTTAYVLDRHLQPVPVGVPGELCLGGPGLAHGYVNRPEETAARFVPHPFDPTPGARIYRTGDRARWRPDGALEYLGRLDSQVKIRGLRIEIGEIEAVLRRHPGVSDAAVIAREDGAGKRLVAGVVATPGTTLRPEELREHALQTLPAYMVPAAFVTLDALPLTPNGKLDRRALAAAAPDAAARPAPARAAVAAGSLEAQLIDLWQAVLRVRPLGVDDDFFELGGDSLTAARMVQQVGDLTGCPLPLTALYDSPTIARLAGLLRRRGEPGLDVTSPALTLNRGGDRPPVFLFHGMLTGGAFYALRLSRRLGPRQPVHVVHPFTGATAPVPRTIEAMVDEHLRVVRERQPEGPYRLVGYCNGGLVAYECARRLRQAGEAVELLVLIAAAPVTPFTRTGRLLRRLGSLAGLSPEPLAEPVARLRSFLEALTALPPRRRPGFVTGKSVELARRAVRRPRRAGAGAPVMGVMDLYHRIVMRYFAPPYPGPVVLLWPEREPWGTAEAAAAAWRRLVPAVSVHVVPGDHLAVVHEQLDALASQLAHYLDADASPDTAGERARPGLSLAMPPVPLDLVEAVQYASELVVCLA